MFVRSDERMRVCAACCESKPETQFNWRRKDKGWLQGYCKSCQSDSGVRHYLAHKERFHTRKKKAKRLHLEQFLKWLSEHPCIDCGETEPILLDCDHVRGTKKFNIGFMVSNLMPWEKIEKELDKCVVRCIVCHRRKTAVEQGWGRLLLQDQAKVAIEPPKL
jgi:hypothetical protein